MSDAPRFVVGLGASAGGLEALERFFDGAPADAGGAFVVVMHLARDFKSMLDDLLARHTSMKVYRAADGMELKANAVYVIQAATTLEVDERRLRVASMAAIDGRGAAATIDQLFRSIASSWGERSGAVVLSGSGSDGAQGVLAVHRAGGFACAQSPETAKFDSMPLAAIASNGVRAVEAPEQLASTVIDGVLLPRIAPTPIIAQQDEALAKILKSVVGVSSLDASKYKHSTFERRVRRRMMETRDGSVEAYAERVAADPSEARRLAESLLIGVTEFFRDEAAFDVIREQAVPDIIRRAQAAGRPIRIWSPGCATGEEPYSLAMLFAKALEDLPSPVDIQIFATDVKREHLAFAGRGEYDNERLKALPKGFRERFFAPRPGETKSVVAPFIRKMIVFAPHDVLGDPPFTRLDLVACRNLLIYFSLEAQQKIVSNFAFGLLERGWLFLGPSETVGGQRNAFEIVDARNRVFRRTASRPLNPSFHFSRGTPPAEASQVTPRLGARRRETALQPAYAALLREYAPPSLLISQERELLHTFGDARRYLFTPEGVANLDVAEMVDPALKTPIVAGVERALADGKPIRFSRVKLARAPHAVEESARGGASVDLVIKPLAAEGDERPSYVIAAIENAADAPADGEAVATVVGGDALAQARIDELERELARTREALQSTIEQIETTNEELQASNEELMSSNEELQSTNEELSSVNEELYSVNAEYHHQNEELTRLSDDLDLLLGSTDVGVIFLDGRLNIDRYTMLPGELFNLADADLGRPLSTFRSPFEDFDPSALVREAIAAEASVERETRDREGAAWLVRAAPYARRPGAVLTVINIGSLREAETEARRNAQMLEVIRNVSNAFFVEVSRNLSSIDAMLGVDDFLGERAARARRPIQLLAAAHPDDRRALAMRFVGADQRHAGQRRGGQGGAGDNGSGDADAGEFNCVVRIWSREHGGYRHVRVNAALGPSPLGDDHARVAWRVAGVDVDAVARSELEVRERDEILTAVLRASPSMAGFVDADGRLRYVNHAYETYFGVAFDDAIGRALRETMPSEIYEAAAPRVAAAIGGERQSFVIEDALADGRRARLAATFEPTTDRRGAPAGFALTIRDVTKYYDEAANLAAVDRALAKAVRASDTAVVLVDAETGDALYANAGAKARLGYRRDLDLPTGVRIARLTPEWTEKNWLDWFGEARLGDDVVRRDVVVFDPSQIAAKADVFVTIVEDGGRRFAFVRVVENAERAAAVQNLRERSRQLAISNRDLEQFASVVAHDLRAPLRHINQFSEFLRDEVAGLKSRDADVYLKMIAEGADAMSDMIEGLLDYARLDRAPREFRALDPAACARKAAEYLQSEVDAAGATLRIDELPSIVGDETLIIRLFQNMIGNSLKYRRADATLAIVIRSEAKRDDAVARISVADNGIGVKKTHAEKIFKLFQRLHSEDEIPGLGVGLATCRRICELHNGEIELDRAYEFGAKFLISLPIARSETSPTTYAAE